MFFAIIHLVWNGKKVNCSRPTDISQRAHYQKEAKIKNGFLLFPNLLVYPCFYSDKGKQGNVDQAKYAIFNTVRECKTPLFFCHILI